MLGSVLADRYEVLGVLGKGALYVVYRARPLVEHREVAVKRASLGRYTSESSRGALADVIVMQALRSPWIIESSAAYLHQTSRILTVEVPIYQFTLTEVRTLYLRQHGSISARVWLRVAHAILNALVYLHNLSRSAGRFRRPQFLDLVVDLTSIDVVRGKEIWDQLQGVKQLCHGDIKPTNVMVNLQEDLLSFQSIVLIDFTSCSLGDSRAYSPAYSLPGRDRRPPIPMDDIWGLRCTLSELATGKPDASIAEVLERLHPQGREEQQTIASIMGCIHRLVRKATDGSHDGTEAAASLLRFF
ncbi:Kinase, NEK [Giardia muris]|uniref:non-specific serine/threonine protein kinase n=1 Tax=Giardia muris TaxID=5742 RepID=A0A4Z1SNC7_GIAMU|nr:Kinase, NEK [Giardia muris]|eukprot:TNJ27120.1 Kinase, NEK [Giardia muris]